MKKITLLALCLTHVFANAQTLSLENGKEIKISTALIINGETPGGGETKNETNTTTIIKVTSQDDKTYKANSTITRLVTNGEAMGQEMKFDSDKKDDMDSEMGQMMGANINKPSEISIDKADGKITELTKKENESGGMMGTGAKGADAAFFIIPAGKKIGDKWTTNSETDGLKSIKNYEWQSTKDGIATILCNSTTKGTTTKETRGMQMEMTVDTKTTGTILSDVKTGLVKKSIQNAETTGNMEVMGQSIPLNSKMSSTITVE
jgi:Family of unknown function (DUF6263)